MTNEIWKDLFCPLINNKCKEHECAFWHSDGVDDFGKGSAVHPCSISIIGYHFACLGKIREREIK